jgi:hypothetical protein
MHFRETPLSPHSVLLSKRLKTIWSLNLLFETTEAFAEFDSKLSQDNHFKKAGVSTLSFITDFLVLRTLLAEIQEFSLFHLDWKTEPERRINMLWHGEQNHEKFDVRSVRSPIQPVWKEGKI